MTSGEAGPESSGPALALAGATLRRGSRTLWQDLDLELRRGEFLAVLGPNGAGKTSLLTVILGLLPLTSGSVRIAGRPARRGSDAVGYVPQQKSLDADLGARGRDLVTLGAIGHRYGRIFPGRSARRQVDRAIAAVGASAYAGRPIGRLSGGEQQRLRIAQALIGDPALLLCDEPLLSLDLNHQREVVELIDRRRREAGTAVVMVTHEINPILPVVDRVLYLVGGRWTVGTADEVMTSATLSALYDTDVDVVRIRGRILVVGATDSIGSQPATDLATDNALHPHPIGTATETPAGGSR